MQETNIRKLRTSGQFNHQPWKHQVQL